MKSRIVRITMSKQVTDQLRREILTQTIPCGSRITVQSIAERYAVSAIPVREAFHALSGEKLLEMNSYKGATVCRIDKKYVSDTYDIMRMLELLMVEDVLSRYDEMMRYTLQSLNEQMRAIFPSEGEDVHEVYRPLNRAFHNALESGSTNRHAIDQMQDYRDIYLAIWQESPFMSYDRMLQCVQEHDRILSALESGNTQRISYEYNQHALNAKAYLLRMLTFLD